jgi:hypothetical protein
MEQTPRDDERETGFAANVMAFENNRRVVAWLQCWRKLDSIVNGFTD